MTTFNAIDSGTPGQAVTKNVTNNTLSNVASVSGSFTAGHYLISADSAGTISDGGSFPTITLTGNVTGSGTTSIATTITSGAVTLANLANLSATSLIGNATGSSATPTAIPFSTFLQPPGSTAITTLGTITTGTWQGTNVGLGFGGTNASLSASNGGIVYSTSSAMAILPGNVTANLPLLSGASTTPTWGSFALSLGGAFTTANAITFTGNFAFTGTLTNTTNITFPTSGTLATTSQLPTPAALTEVNDTNVTLTLGGTPATALLQATSITAGWTGQLSLARGGTNANLTAVNGGIVYSAASAMAITSAANNSVLVTSNTGVPSLSTTLPSAVQTNITAVANSAITLPMLANLAAHSVIGNITASSAAPTAVATSNFLQTINSVIVSSSGTYTPSTGIQFAFVIVTGAGGGGGGTVNGSSACGGGGGGGASAWCLLTAATIGASQSITIGAAGSAGVSGGGTGGTGGATSFGSLIICNGGAGGAFANNGAFTSAAGGARGLVAVATATTIKMPGRQGGLGISYGGNNFGVGGEGGYSGLTVGSGGQSLANSAGSNGSGIGAGGSGAGGTAAAAGGAGTAGQVIIFEFIAI